MCFMKLTNGCVYKLGIPHYHPSDGLYICTSYSLVFTTLIGIITNIENTHHSLTANHKYCLYVIYVDNPFLFYSLSLVTILICQLTAEDKFMKVPEAKCQ